VISGKRNGAENANSSRDKAALLSKNAQQQSFGIKNTLSDTAPNGGAKLRGGFA
jgi:hypothetical protein